MNRETQNAALIVLALYLLNETLDLGVRAVKRVKREVNVRVVDPLERAGARVYDVVHNDAGHQQDLPGKQLTRQAVLAIAKHVGFPDPKLAAAIALAESGGVPNALNRSSREVSVGLWQINTLKHPYTADNMRDPIKNARAAYTISRGGTNWSAWPTFTKGRYRQFQTGILAP
jgi:hypothetical protein